MPMVEPATAASGGGGRAAARTIWALCGLSVLLAAGSLVLAALNGVSLGRLISLHLGVGTAAAAALPLLGARIVARHPRNRYGWVLVAQGVFVGTFVFTIQYAPLALGISRPGVSLPAGTLASWLATWTMMPSIMSGLTFLILLFPDGTLPSPRWRPVAWAAVAGTAGVTGTLAALNWPARGPGLARALWEGSAGASDAVFSFGFLLAQVLLVPSVVAVLLRFRRSTGVRRQQFKWFAYGGLLAAPLNLGAGLPGVGPVLELLSVPVMFGALAVAMFRYRLYDVDRLVNRTLVYGSLTAILAGAYALGVLVIGAALSAGQRPSSLAVAATTLAVAAAVQPLRRGIQNAVDRRFNRRSYDAARTIASFSARIRQEVDLDTMSAELLAVVRQTMEPTGVSLWLRPTVGPAGGQPGRAAGRPSPGA